MIRKFIADLFELWTLFRPNRVKSHKRMSDMDPLARMMAANMNSASNFRTLRKL